MRIYLSRSNASDPEVFSFVNKKLIELGHEVVTFHGGVYDKKDLLSCDSLIIVPPASVLDSRSRTSSSIQSLGRGQYEQVVEFTWRKIPTNASGNISERRSYESTCGRKVLLIRELGSSQIYVDNIISSWKSMEEDWKLNYGIIEGDDESLNMQVVLGVATKKFVPEPERKDEFGEMIQKDESGKLKISKELRKPAVLSSEEPKLMLGAALLFKV